MDNVLKDALKDIFNINRVMIDVRHNVFVLDGCDIVRKLTDIVNHRLIDIIYIS